MGGIAARRHVRTLGIKHVYNILTQEEYGSRAPWVWFDTPGDEVSECHLTLDETVADNVRPIIAIVLPEIEEKLARHERVLVHCAAGVSRSAAVVIAYMMRRDRCSYERALATLRAIRPKVNPNPAFVAQLKALSSAGGGGS